MLVLLENVISAIDKSVNLLSCSIIFSIACISTYKTWKEKTKPHYYETISLLVCSILCGLITIICIIGIVNKIGLETGINAKKIAFGMGFLIFYVIVSNAVMSVFGKLEPSQSERNALKNLSVKEVKGSKNKKKKRR